MTSSNKISNEVGDHVYVRHEHLVWVPAIVLRVDEDRLQVRIELPNEWDKTTAFTFPDEENVSEAISTHPKMMYNRTSLHGTEQWVHLREYYNHTLPMQNTHLAYNDMFMMPHWHEAALLYQIKERHCNMERPYTRVGELLLVVNPREWLPDLYSEDQQSYYLELYRNKKCTSSNSCIKEKKDDNQTSITVYTLSGSDAVRTTQVECEPHIYEVSALAYQAVSVDHTNQTILVSGESGSGKTECVKLLLHHLASIRQTKLSAGGNVQDDLVQHLLQSSIVFEAFGNASTLLNKNSTRFGKVIKLQYFTETNEASLTGGDIETYMLETSRVSSQRNGERNFHIFYQILSASTDLKKELLGPEWGGATHIDFRYLNPNKDSQCDENDKKLFDQTIKSMEAFGWEGKDLQTLMQALGAILLLGNVEFIEDPESAGLASIASHADLSMLAHSLGVAIEELEHKLLTHSVETSKEELHVRHSPAHAKASRDALAEAIYEGVFASITHRIACHTSMPSHTEDKYKTISLVDIFGFENVDLNRFEQLCVNYASERLQYKFARENLDHFTSEYESDGIELPEWKQLDNADTILLFEGKAGLIRTLTEQTVRSNGTVDMFAFKTKTTNKGHNSLFYDKLQSRLQFGVHHFAGSVVYDANDFIERNIDNLSESLLCVAMKTSNSLISHELMEMHRRRIEALLAVHNATNKRPSKKTVIQKFCKQLRDLLLSINADNTRYIQCIRPTSAMEVRKVIDHQDVLRQIQSAGLATAIGLSRETFPKRVAFPTILDQFSCLVPTALLQSIKDMAAHDKVQVLMSTLFAPYIQRYRGSDFAMPFACGHKNVYFRARSLEYIKEIREECITSASIQIQCFMKGVALKQRYRRTQKGVVLLQAQFRGKILTRCYRNKKECTRKIQSWIRCFITEAKFVIMRENAFVIQHWIRRVLLKINFRRSIRAIYRMIIWSRMQIIRRRYVSFLRSITTLQAHARRQNDRQCYSSKRRAQIVISRWWNAIFLRLTYLRKKQGATLLTSWSRARIVRHRFCHFCIVITILQTRFRSCKIRMDYTHQKRAVRTLTSSFQSILARQRYRRIQLTTTTISAWFRSRLQRIRFKQIKCCATLLASWYRSRKAMHQHRAYLNAAALFCQNRRYLIASQNLAKQHTAARNIQQVVRRRQRTERQSLAEDIEQYKEQIWKLKNDISTISAEASLHVEEIEAECEERLGEYEAEVLLLKQNIEEYKREEQTMKEEISANVDNIKNLKAGIKIMQQSHKEYLNKVMRAIDKANADHRAELVKVKQDRDVRLHELEFEIKMLKEGNDPANQKRNYDIDRLARKLERLIAPDYIAAMVEKASANSTTTVECVEQKVSSKARKIIYRLEDIARGVPTSLKTEKDETIEALQQQLMRAYEEVGRLERCTYAEKNSVQKLGLRRVFQR